MTIKLLSDAEKVKLLREARKAYAKNQYPKGRPKNNEHGYQDEYDDILANYDPRDDCLTDLHMAEFPMCCGALILCDFPYPVGRSKKLAIVDSYTVQLEMDTLLREEAEPMVVAILNEDQQAGMKDIMKKFGGELFPKQAVGHHKLKLYLWVFIKGTPRKKKRVFP